MAISAQVTQLGLEPSRRVAPRIGGEIAAVRAGSAADRQGVRPGDWLLAVNGLAIRDLIDYSYETTSAELDLLLERGGRRYRLRVLREADEDLGLEFRLPVFEGIRECNNNCEFCFIRGLPKGLRTTLYIRDDDYRYSFLFGNFVTLTNLDEQDWQRIGFQRLSPLHVSVHATDPVVRRRMLANPAAPDIRPQLDRLGRLGIEVKAQVVLCPGLNDGEVLEQTIRELAERATTAVDSVAVVPVGLTRYSRARGLRAVTPAEADELIRRARVWQRDLRQRLGRDFVYLSDELYLLAGRPFPAASRYDGFRQLENGVGLTRLLLQQWSRVKPAIPDGLDRPRRVVWVCGRAAAPALRRMAADLGTVRQLNLTVLEVSNDFFGGGVSVSGLLAGRDVAAALSGTAADLAILPRMAFGFDGRQTIDGWRLEAIEQAAGLRLELASAARELLDVTLAG
jgi:putative radical SAM enzyme (TIGR03279 family)